MILARHRFLAGILLAFVALQIADIATTNHMLANPAVFEANPFMAWSQGSLGALWWLPKAIVVCLCLWIIPRAHIAAVAVALAVQSAVVVNNFMHFG